MWRVALACCSIFFALVASGAGAPRTVPLTPCTLTNGVGALCGTFDVPENRTEPGGRSISLRIAVLPARDGGSKSDPVVDLAGGPGGSAIANASLMLSVFSAVNDSRDIVLVDQRGTGGSNELVCPTPTKPLTTIATVRAYAKGCLAGLAADASQYTTAPAMDDLADVLRALGYDRVNIYGGSYGATAAQYLVVQHPELVRTAILDGGTLLDVPIFELWGKNGDRALRSILARCAGSKRCAKGYPRVRREVFEMIAALRGKPVRIDGMVIDAATAEGAVQAMSRSPESAAQIPWVAHQARMRDWLPLELAIQDNEQPTSMQVTYWSIVCNEPWARWDPGRTAAASRGTYLAERTALDARLAAVVCAVMPKSAQPTWSSARPSTETPILFVVGGADPQDPLANVAGAAATMPNSRTIVVPSGGHGSIQLGCVPSLARQFVDEGGAAGLDARCITQYKPPAFVVAH